MSLQPSSLGVASRLGGWCLVHVIQFIRTEGVLVNQQAVDFRKSEDTFCPQLASFSLADSPERLLPESCR